MAAISLFWYTNMAAVTSDENDLLVWHKGQYDSLDNSAIVFVFEKKHTK
jgi:hypothetical protein